MGLLTPKLRGCGYSLVRNLRPMIAPDHTADLLSLAELDSLRCPLRDLGKSGKPLTFVGRLCLTPEHGQ